MELRHLRYFVGVAETLNFREAAKRLHVSAPALSQQIKFLEEEMGVRLFDRKRTGTRLTNAGRVFQSEATSLLAAATQAQESAKEAAQGARGQLRVGYNSGLLAELMPKCLMVFSAKFPQVDVELVDLNPAEQISGLETDVIQLGFIALPRGLSAPPGIASAPILRTSPRVILGRSHRLATLAAVPLAELTHERMLVLSGPRWSTQRENVVQIFHARHRRPPKIVEISRLDALLAMVAGGRGVTLLPWKRKAAYAEDIVVSPLAETGPDMEIEIRAFWRESRDSALQQEFITVLREIANPGS